MFCSTTFVVMEYTIVHINTLWQHMKCFCNKIIFGKSLTTKPIMNADRNSQKEIQVFSNFPPISVDAEHRIDSFENTTRAQKNRPLILKEVNKFVATSNNNKDLIK